MAEYLVLLHEDPAVTRKLSPTEMQALIERYSEWVGGLRADGLVTVGKKLKDEGGRHLRSEKGKMVVSVVSYACHPTTLAWENTQISPDFPGAMRGVIEQVTAAPCVFRSRTCAATKMRSTGCCTRSRWIT